MYRLGLAGMMLVVVLMFGWAVQAAGDAAKGETLAKSCTCHRTDLDGMSADSFAKKMQGFKDGSLENRIMNRIARNYSDEKIQDLAAWFASK